MWMAACTSCVGLLAHQSAYTNTVHESETRTRRTSQAAYLQRILLASCMVARHVQQEYALADARS